jgi:hypothetical protein
VLKRLTGKSGNMMRIYYGGTDNSPLLFNREAFDADCDSMLLDMRSQAGRHVTVWFHCVPGLEFIIQGIDSIPTNFKLNGTPIRIED